MAEEGDASQRRQKLDTEHLYDNAIEQRHHTQPGEAHQRRKNQRRRRRDRKHEVGRNHNRAQHIQQAKQRALAIAVAEPAAAPGTDHVEEPDGGKCVRTEQGVHATQHQIARQMRREKHEL